MDLWTYGLMDLWTYGLMDLWTYGFKVLWTYDKKSFISLKIQKNQNGGHTNRLTDLQSDL